MGNRITIATTELNRRLSIDNGGNVVQLSVTNENVTRQLTVAAGASVTHSHVITDVTGLQTALDGKQAAGDYATNTALTNGLSTKANTSHTHAIADVTNLQTTLDGKAAKLGNVFKQAALLGDSITGQHQSEAALPITGSQGFWNWANWYAGSPFDFSSRLGVSGDTAANILSRIWQIPGDIDTVFIVAGTNDVNNFSSSATAGQVTAEIDRLIGTNGVFTLGLQRLKAAGKNVCIGTIPPNNGWSTSTDTRIQVLDAVNTWILESESAGRVTKAVDLFTPMWDNTQPTIRVFKTNYSYDGTHLRNAAGQVGGKAALTALKAMYAASQSISYKYNNRILPNALISSMRTITGVSSTITYGSGTLASGWRSLNNGSGTPTLVLSNSNSYTVGADYVGPFAQMLGVDEKWQKLTITNAVSGSSIRVQLASPSTTFVINPGDNFFITADFFVESHTNLSTVTASAWVFITQGTSPVDQSFFGTNNTRTTSNVSSNSQTEIAYPESSFRIMLNSEPLRIGENINGTVALTTQIYLDSNFVGNGGAVINIGRVAIWRAMY